MTTRLKPGYCVSTANDLKYKIHNIKKFIVKL